MINQKTILSSWILKKVIYYSLLVVFIVEILKYKIEERII